MNNANKPKRELRKNAKSRNCTKQMARQVKEKSQISIKYIFMYTNKINQKLRSRFGIFYKLVYTPHYHANLQVFSAQLCERVLHVHDPTNSPIAAKTPKIKTIRVKKDKIFQMNQLDCSISLIK